MTAARTVSLVAVVFLALVVGGAPHDARSAGSACNPAGRLVGHTVVYCGLAVARLDAFPGAVFRNGSCRATTVNGVPHFFVRLGARTQNARTNDARPYFGLVVTGSLASPSGGGVIAYWKGRRWGGAGVSFAGSARAGSFVAVGINRSRGRATGHYRC